MAVDYRQVSEVLGKEITTIEAICKENNLVTKDKVDHEIHLFFEKKGVFHTPDDDDDTQTDGSTQQPAALEANDDDDVHRFQRRHDAVII